MWTVIVLHILIGSKLNIFQKKFIGINFIRNSYIHSNKNIKANIYRIQANNLITCEYCLSWIYWFYAKRLKFDRLHQFIFRIKYEKSDNIILEYFRKVLRMWWWRKSILLIVISKGNLKDAKISYNIDKTLVFSIISRT